MTILQQPNTMKMTRKVWEARRLRLNSEILKVLVKVLKYISVELRGLCFRFAICRVSGQNMVEKGSCGTLAPFRHVTPG
jgi:hypothetical protein